MKPPRVQVDRDERRWLMGIGGVVTEHVTEESDGRHSLASVAARGCIGCWDDAVKGNRVEVPTTRLFLEVTGWEAARESVLERKKGVAVAE
jgi:hypothetical protein